jgi:hypothetical protein
MAKTYHEMPGKLRWRLDMGLEGLFGHKSAALERINKLLDIYHDSARDVARRALSIFHIHLATRFLVKHFDQPDKLGGALNARQRDAVTGLNAYTHTELTVHLGLWEGVPDQRLDDDAGQEFGRQVCPQGAAEDLHRLGSNTLLYYITDLARAPFKLSFRGGLAWKWARGEDGGRVGQGPTELYDTDIFGDNIESEGEGSVYVLDTRGRLYTTGKEEGDRQLKHSSLMGGQAVLMAGTMRVKDGQIVWVSGKSGHYKPTVAQMVTLLERLSHYAVDLHRVTVYRENYTKERPGSPSKWFEPCKAMDLLRRRAWPTGEAPQAMFVG